MSAPYLPHAWMDFNNIWYKCSQQQDDVKSETYGHIGLRSRSHWEVKDHIHCISSNIKHQTSVSAPYLSHAWMDFHIIWFECSQQQQNVQNVTFGHVGSRSYQEVKHDYFSSNSCVFVSATYLPHAWMDLKNSWYKC